MASKDADKWITLTFQTVEAGVTRQAIVILNSHRIGETFEDLSEPVAQILATAIQAQAGYSLIRADVTTEITSVLNFP